MSERDADTIQPEHVERWLAVTRQYLFSDDSVPCVGDAQPPGPCHRQRRRWVDIARLLDELDRPQPAGSLSPACREGGTLRRECPRTPVIACRALIADGRLSFSRGETDVGRSKGIDR